MKTAAFIFAAAVLWAADGGVLYNGIRLPAQWPPSDLQLSHEPQPPPPLSALAAGGHPH